MARSIREETIERSIIESDKFFFLDFSKYNIFRKKKIKVLQDLVKTHYYVEIFSNKKIKWTFQTRSFRTFEAEHWYMHKLQCPVCSKGVFRIYNKQAICTMNHRVQIKNLLVKFLGINRRKVKMSSH